MKELDIVQSRFQLIAIDLDGTLVDTVGDLHTAVINMQTQMSLEQATVAEVRSWVGNGIERLVHRALSNDMSKDADPALFDIAMPLFKQAYKECNGSGSILFPGVPQGLDWLRTLDIPLIVVTNKARQFAEPLLAALDIAPYFQHLIAGDDVARKKPHPEALIEAARRCNIERQSCLLIGDSVSDAKAARAAEFSSISVSYGYNHNIPVSNLLQDALTDAVVDSFTELPAVIEQLSTT